MGFGVGIFPDRYALSGAERRFTGLSNLAFLAVPQSTAYQTALYFVPVFVVAMRPHFSTSHGIVSSGLEAVGVRAAIVCVLASLRSVSAAAIGIPNACHIRAGRGGSVSGGVCYVPAFSCGPSLLIELVQSLLLSTACSCILASSWTCYSEAAISAHLRRSTLTPVLNDSRSVDIGFTGLS
jgi:hypothetical protein